MQTITQLAKKHHAWVEATFPHKKTVLENLALICSEIGEAVNECRGEKPTDKLGSELADIVLRVMDLSVREGLDLEAEILKKMEKNAQNGNRGRLK